MIFRRFPAMRLREQINQIGAHALTHGLDFAGHLDVAAVQRLALRNPRLDQPEP